MKDTAGPRLSFAASAESGPLGLQPPAGEEAHFNNQECPPLLTCGRQSSTVCG